MTKEKMRKLAEKYGMKIMWNADRQRAFGLILDADHAVPELDSLLQSCGKGVVFWRYDWYDGTISYRVDCPYEWFDKDHWA